MEEMQEGKPKEATAEEVRAAVSPELMTDLVRVGGVDHTVRPMPRRWQKLFDAAALPLFEAEAYGPEAILKAAQANEPVNFANAIVQSALDADIYLDRAAAVVMASVIPGAEKDPEKAIQDRIAWLQDNARTEDMQALVDAQVRKEGVLARVGERLPVRFDRLLNLAGIKTSGSGSAMQFLTSLLQKLQETRSGAGDSTTPKPSGSSSDGSAATQ